MTKTGLALIHEGEAVVPRNRRGGGVSVGDINVTVGYGVTRREAARIASAAVFDRVANSRAVKGAIRRANRGLD